MDEKLAWEQFKKTGEINAYLEMKQMEKAFKESNELKNGIIEKEE